MKKLLNTLYVTTEGAGLRKDGENLVVSVENAELGRVPFHMLASVVAFGSVYLSPGLMEACCAAGITIALLDRAGRFQARIEGPVSGNVLLRRAQYRASEAPDQIVRGVVSGKIANQRAVLMRALRDHGGDMPAESRDAIGGAIDRLAQILRRVGFSNGPTDVLRGGEGEAASLYFSVFGHLSRTPDEALRFRGRSRRPPLDPVNALLSFLYTLLTHDCRSAAESVGLDPAVGFLHRDRPGRPSLALDLMEELRPVLADVSAGQKARKDDGDRIGIVQGGGARSAAGAPFAGRSCVRLERLFLRPGLPSRGRSARRLSNARQRHRSHALAWRGATV